MKSCYKLCMNKTMNKAMGEKINEGGYECSAFTACVIDKTKPQVAVEI